MKGRIDLRCERKAKKGKVAGSHLKVLGKEVAKKKEKKETFRVLEKKT